MVKEKGWGLALTFLHQLLVVRGPHMTSSTTRRTRVRMMLATVPAAKPAGFGSWPGQGKS